MAQAGERAARALVQGLVDGCAIRGEDARGALTRYRRERLAQAAAVPDDADVQAMTGIVVDEIDRVLETLRSAPRGGGQLR